ncbi:DUF3243 domain-containing protein [Paenibacillus sp. 1001270B_150601_E10]|uniref:DUF3243 domain-containing protein n=1 Tax=Paenibacillus sp. 1001270B_150601_E10 TaxID=2787079 RepID=UPI00189CFFD3|nr:DUF3243 domain-containing protein [Paenibacillus sp. 1001270B_150601_E10]
MASVLKNYDSWKKFLGDRVKNAKTIGMTEDTINNLAFEIGSFLDEKVDPQNPQERAIKELWEVGNESERKTIASLMVRLAEKNSQ